MREVREMREVEMREPERMPRGVKVKLITLAVIILLAIANDSRAMMFEDDPRWNCREMGNGICGVDPIFGTWSLTSEGKTYA